jgi:pimeloyl-ACP methyl ester carboxylesterase
MVEYRQEGDPGTWVRALSHGTRIVYGQHGSGPPLVLVHGGFVDRTFWGPSVPLLARHFTVYAMDRRGHGNSDPYPADHDIEREYEDVVTLIATLGGPVALLGHSTGALVALHAARHSSEVNHLVLYEAPRLDAFTLAPALRPRLWASLASGDLDGMVSTVLVDTIEATLNPGLPREALQQVQERLRQEGIWPAMLRNAESIPAEADSYATYRFDPAEFHDFRTPTVLLLGSTSSPLMRRWVEDLHAALPFSRITVLQGQGHAATITAPELFVRAVREALDRGPDA